MDDLSTTFYYTISTLIGLTFLWKILSEELVVQTIYIASIFAIFFVIAFWNDPTILQFRFGIKMEDITVAPKPSDCDFLTAPLGLKLCHYEITINEQGERLYVEWRRMSSSPKTGE